MVTSDATLDRAKPQSSLRQRLFTGLGGGVALAAVAFGIWWFAVGAHHVTTEDAYVGADIASITPQVSGTVSAAPVGDTETVKAGQVLAVIDPTDAKIALAGAEADYQRALRQVRQSLASTDAASAQTDSRTADLARRAAETASAQAQYAKAKLDYDRRASLAASGAVSGEEVSNATTSLTTADNALKAAKAVEAQARADLAAAKDQEKAQAALTQGAGVEDNPSVLAAKAALDQARLNLERTTLRAPFDGVVAKKNVQIGQRIATGVQLMTVVPLDKVYVDANFKEVQLRKVRIGAPVELKSDLYGGGFKFHGVASGIGGGTGAAFAVIPAQNATGNWIKVVQRLPVRITLDPAELKTHPLRVGLSMSADIDISDKH